MTATTTIKTTIGLMFNSFSRRQIVKVAVGLAAGIACILETQTIVQAQIVPGTRYVIKTLGNIPGPRYLDGRTYDGTVGLVPSVGGGNSGAIWTLVPRGGNVYVIRTCGTIPPPINYALYLDGRTANGTVGLGTLSLSGTTWEVSDWGNYYTIRTLGNIPGPSYLDGRTANGTVGLTSNLDLSGTRWHLVPTNLPCLN